MALLISLGNIKPTKKKMAHHSHLKDAGLVSFPVECSGYTGWKIRIQFNSSICNCPVWLTPLVEDGVFSSKCVAFLLLKIQVTIGLWACMWVLNPMPLVSMSVFMVSMSVFIPLWCCFHYGSSVVWVEIWNSAISSIGELWENYFLDTAGQLYMWAHSAWDSIHKTCVGSSQIISQPREGRWAKSHTLSWIAIRNK